MVNAKIGPDRMPRPHWRNVWWNEPAIGFNVARAVDSVSLDRMQRIRVGIIGAGDNTRKRHIPGFLEIPGVEVTRVCNRSEASSRRAAAEFRIPGIAGEWREIVEDDEIDAICIGTWPYLHAEAAIAALDAGKHVLTEARMARNAEEAEAMLEASRRHPDRVAQIVPAPFSLPFDATVREWIAESRYGALREVRATHAMGAALSPDAPLTWRQDVAKSGHNMLTMGIFYETIQRWLGREPEWLVADAAVFTPQRHDPEAGRERTVEIPDSLSVLARYGDGARLVMHFTGVEAGPGVMEARLLFERATVRFDFAHDEMWLAEAGESIEEAVEIAPAKRGRWRVEADFIESIREGKPAELTGFEQGVRYMRFTDAVWRSWNAGAARQEIEDA